VHFCPDKITPQCEPRHSPTENVSPTKETGWSNPGYRRISLTVREEIGRPDVCASEEILVGLEPTDGGEYGTPEGAVIVVTVVPPPDGAT
jgi:hypothetical protein